MCVAVRYIEAAEAREGRRDREKTESGRERKRPREEKAEESPTCRDRKEKYIVIQREFNRETNTEH